MNKPNQEGNSTEPQQHEEHHSWLHNIIEKMQNLDADFPLSGGEPHPQVHYHAPEEPTNEMKQTDDAQEEVAHVEEHKHHTWLGDLVEKMQNLDSDFPLSGGEPSHH
jgi:hypothetical protein